VKGLKCGPHPLSAGDLADVWTPMGAHHVILLYSKHSYDTKSPEKLTQWQSCSHTVILSRILFHWLSYGKQAYMCLVVRVRYSLTYLCRAGAIDANDNVIVFKVGYWPPFCT